ncbi:hypothetical protein [uncultured Pseudomonas sp.]|uniref:hypothetical protein n=1 Tax=uncultured Pseudomonas sp. TaxID=114707 RepID=UPI0025879EB6|nr:hypothetical protein [uncultured Pseudomonas sp.]
MDEGIPAAIIINLIIITMIIQCIIAARGTEYYESLFPNSQYIEKNKATYEQAGLLGKLMRTGAISTVLIMPSVFTKRKLVAQEDIASFPKNAKNLLITLWAIEMTLFTCLMISHYLKPQFN